MKQIEKVCFYGKDDFFQGVYPQKRNRFGIKLFLLCDCETRYIPRLFICTGKDNAVPGVVKNLETQVQ